MRNKVSIYQYFKRLINEGCTVPVCWPSRVIVLLKKTWGTILLDKWKLIITNNQVWAWMVWSLATTGTRSTPSVTNVALTMHCIRVKEDSWHWQGNCWNRNCQTVPERLLRKQFLLYPLWLSPVPSKITSGLSHWDRTPYFFLQDVK